MIHSVTNQQVINIMVWKYHVISGCTKDMAGMLGNGPKIAFTLFVVVVVDFL